MIFKVRVICVSEFRARQNKKIPTKFTNTKKMITFVFRK